MLHMGIIRYQSEYLQTQGLVHRYSYIGLKKVLFG